MAVGVLGTLQKLLLHLVMAAAALAVMQIVALPEMDAKGLFALFGPALQDNFLTKQAFNCAKVG